MPGLLEDTGIFLLLSNYRLSFAFTGPSYLCSESAEVILSEVRKTRLRLDVLKALNTLLDEFLFNIIKNASSLSTDKLRASLLGVLPTSLGKEALLEAEVELRAYYEQMGTDAVSPFDDDSKAFNLHHAFELLRLKCAAYSTLNDSDEDPKAEARVMEKMRDGAGVLPFSSARIAPASMYLTAIVEALCEHILVNVAKVTARDSSRTDATAHDLFIALCEDEAIYGMFKSMKVYEQIEHLSNSSQHNRSKSFLRGSSERSISRLSSVPQDLTATMTSSNSSHTRVSAETSTTQSPASVSGFSEKSRAVKKLISSRPSQDRDESQTTFVHKRSTSQSDSLRRNSSDYEDAAALQEFDDLVRSSSTMKVSLTPDRLRTMEAFKQEKDQRAHKSLPNKVDFDPAAVSRRPSLRQVESIVEDEEEGTPSKQSLPSRHRQGSITSSPSPSLISLASRNRSLSMSTPGSRAFGKKVLRNIPPPISSSHLFHNSSRSSLHMPPAQDASAFPTRTRKIQRNLETMDLDEIMNGMDDEGLASTSAKQPRGPVTPSRSSKAGVSSTTRDLMDFLAEGPPEPPRYPGDVFDTPNGRNAADAAKKNPGRLQRMISKLSLGPSEKARMLEERAPLSPPPVPNLVTKPSTGTLSSLANKPIPPRYYPRPPSPPSTPSSLEGRTSSQAKLPIDSDPDTRLPRSPQVSQSRSPSNVALKQDDKENASKHHGHETKDQGTNLKTLNHHNQQSAPVENAYPITPPPSQTSSVTPVSSYRKPVPLLDPPVSPSVEVNPSPLLLAPSELFPDTDAREMHRLMSVAGSADECRIILEMFMARSGIKCDKPVPAPSALPVAIPTAIDVALENAIVELLLSGETPLEVPISPRRLRTKRHKKYALRPHTVDGSTIPRDPVPNISPVSPTAS
ncbi:hypothetical protein M378DRAFT_7248 [Amanita muscaria Koide BX008]|uniref:Uncharacterized protein n=1 Tax=Amanita muscaria (strain Koide BX008) TaxID=946122 RepID=A0A0C2XML3_AMAMK|nr:hypothetical protein M378DRAFT_7248 [Amanita muscaria Koide BX008]